MTRAKSTPAAAATPEAFLAPLARLAARHPGLEGEVLWASDGEAGWQVQDDATELLDAEEIPFYAEGLIMEGFGLLWQAMAEAGATTPDHILLMVWERGASPPPGPDAAEGWIILASGRWEGLSA